MNRNTLYLFFLSIVRYVFTSGVVLGLWVLTIQSGLAPNLTRVFNDVAANLTSAM